MQSSTSSITGVDATTSSSLTCVDAITQAAYGFRVLSVLDPAMIYPENEKNSGIELIGIVRIISPAASINQPDEMVRVAERCACARYFEGKMKIVHADLKILTN